MGEEVCIVTGATSGIGREIAGEFASDGAHVGLISRNMAKADSVVADLRKSYPKARVASFIADLSVLADVRRVAHEIHQHYDRLDVLVNNAGMHDIRPAVSVDGFDKIVATNHLGPFLLTNLVRDLLERAAPSRIVVVASEAHRNTLRVNPESFAAPGSYGRLTSILVYGRTKLLNILFVQEIARRWRGSGISAIAFCPGLVASGLARNDPLLSWLFAVAVHTPLVRRPAQSARMAVRLSADPEFADQSGKFYSSTPGLGLLPTAPPLLDEQLQRAVWERSERLVGLA